MIEKQIELFLNNPETLEYLKIRKKIIEKETEGMTETQKKIYFALSEVRAKVSLTGFITTKEIEGIVKKWFGVDLNTD